MQIGVKCTPCQTEVWHGKQKAGTGEEEKASGGHSGGETPLPIPNRAVKPASADGTRRVTSRESRTPPVFFLRRAPQGALRCLTRRLRVYEDRCSEQDGHGDRRLADEAPPQTRRPARRLG